MVHSLKSKLLPSFLILFIIFYLPAALISYSQVADPIPYAEATITSADNYATQAGIETFQKGGNAIDAAIAVQFALAVTLPRAGNIGGGGFMMLRLANGEIKALDFREKAPSRATEDMFLDESGTYVPELSRTGGLASGVPGTVDGMISALERHGTLPLEVILEPAIRLAREGFRLTHSHAESLNQNRDQFLNFEASEKIFIKQDGSRWVASDILIQLDLADTFERIARRGRDGFYSGYTARLIIDEQQRQGGRMTLRDLRNYESVWRAPIRAQFNSYELFMMPPPSSGGVVMSQVISMINGVTADSVGVNSSEYIHLLSEAFRRSFADRNYFLGDPDFVSMPIETLLSGRYAEERFSDFDPQSATPSSEINHGQIPGFSESDETTHFSVVDADGNAVAITTTLNGSYGSHVTVGGAGFLLNNEMDDFSAKPGVPNMYGLIGAEANKVEPDKRMLSSMSPTIVTINGDLKMVAGGSGGPTIITAVLQDILNVLLYGMNAAQAISSPRFHHQWLPDHIVIERFTMPDDVQQNLRQKGHTLRIVSTLARTHIIVIDDDQNRTAAADPRGHGSVAGY
ncbi:gamma-glutamyltransferase [Rhodohalobacter sp. 8-1]|uniref:gamma-glutamyltransferase n=1 Tax=Rhodohalobacter sp. 8-1 TaxID=3131972 RepID=UPI0030EF5B71